jgi:hypothetical protein
MKGDERNKRKITSLLSLPFEALFKSEVGLPPTWKVEGLSYLLTFSVIYVFFCQKTNRQAAGLLELEMYPPLVSHSSSIAIFEGASSPVRTIWHRYCHNIFNLVLSALSVDTY